MTAIVVAPDLERALVVITGIFQVAADEALVSCACPHGQDCNGIRIRDISLENRRFELLAHTMEQEFVQKQRDRGHELADTNLRLHGPFWSYDFDHTLADVDSSTWRDAMKRDQNGDEHPELTVPLVFERDTTVSNPWRDYAIEGLFMKQAVLTEVVIPDGE